MHVQWTARLSGLTADCSFSDVDETLRDRFVMGMTACPETSKLSEQNTVKMTMAKAVELAERAARTDVERSRRRSRVRRRAIVRQNGDDEASDNSVRQVNSVQRGTGKERRSVFGRRNHISYQICFRKYKCRYEVWYNRALAKDVQKVELHERWQDEWG